MDKNAHCFFVTKFIHFSFAWTPSSIGPSFSKLCVKFFCTPKSHPTCHQVWGTLMSKNDPKTMFFGLGHVIVQTLMLIVLSRYYLSLLQINSPRIKFYTHKIVRNSKILRFVTPIWQLGRENQGMPSTWTGGHRPWNFTISNKFLCTCIWLHSSFPINKWGTSQHGWVDSMLACWAGGPRSLVQISLLAKLTIHPCLPSAAWCVEGESATYTLTECTPLYGGKGRCSTRCDP